MKLVDLSLRSLRADERKLLQGIARLLLMAHPVISLRCETWMLWGPGTRTWNTDPALSLHHLGLDFLSIRFNRAAGPPPLRVAKFLEDRAPREDGDRLGSGWRGSANRWR